MMKVFILMINIIICICLIFIPPASVHGGRPTSWKWPENRQTHGFLDTRCKGKQRGISHTQPDGFIRLNTNSNLDFV